MTTVAVIGTGRMGAAMARTLSAAAFDLIVWNRTQERADAVAAATGARVASSAKDAVAAADVVVSSLADDAAVADAYTSDLGIVAGLHAGSIVVETSTIDPSTVKDLGPRVEAAGGVLLDGPVSGSVSVAEAGQLMFMVGGSADALETAQPVLDALGAAVFHVGALGSGATMKLAVNAVVHSINVAVSESLVLAERAGVDRAAAYDVFVASAAGAPFVKYKRAAFVEPDATPVAFSVDLVLKDLTLIAALAERVGAPMLQARTNRDVTQAAVDAGLGPRDMSAVAELLRSQS